MALAGGGDLEILCRRFRGTELMDEVFLRLGLFRGGDLESLIDLCLFAGGVIE
jgi:hypothetical protein